MPIQNPEEFDIKQAISDLESFDPKKKGDAAVNLGIYGDESHCQILEQNLDSQSEYVFISVHYGLALLGKTESLHALIEHLTNSRKYARKLALAALEETTDLELDADPNNQEACQNAQEEALEWWENHHDQLSWDESEKKYTLG